jgi:hypothetical protein
MDGSSIFLVDIIFFCTAIRSIWILSSLLTTADVNIDKSKIIMYEKEGLFV